MTDFPIDVALGLSVVLVGTLWAIIWIMTMDSRENKG